ncbi:MAG: methyltransferase domain-containing protein [Fibrobacter sp.]|nr:methyltransferase domain-containing protein [Fibrobacter sp.]
MDPFNKVKNHFEEEAKEFDQIILKLIPFYDQMIESLVLSVPFSKDDHIEVIDLGCGTGTVACKIRERFPNSRITCLDIAENMIKMAQAKLGEGPDYRVGDFYTFEFDRKYDLIISSLALHHLAEDESKRSFYRKIYNALSDNGVFYNADVVLGSGEHLQNLYMRKWKEFMNRSVSPDEIESKWIVKYKEEDRPASLMKHLKWLNEIGFQNVDVVWKYYNYAVYGGSR